MGFPGCWRGISTLLNAVRTKAGGSRFVHEVEDKWPELRDLTLCVGDLWVLNKARVTRGSVPHSWDSGCRKAPILQQLDRLYVPVGWMHQVYRAEILSGNYKSDHFPVCLELQLSAHPPPTGISNLNFFRVNMSVALSAWGKAGIQDILHFWTRATSDGSSAWRPRSANAVTS